MGQPILRVVGHNNGNLNLLAKISGFYLDSWNPGRLQLKDGGQWRDPIQVDGRVLTGYQWGNITDVFTFKQRGDCDDDLIHWSRKLDRLLVEAIEYWSGRYSIHPVYLEKRGKDETTTTYALIHGFRLPSDNNPMDAPFVGSIESMVSAQLGLQIAIEHGPWLKNPPGEGEDTPKKSIFCTNLIDNYSFEEWSAGVPVGWTANDTPTLTESTDNVLTGDNSCRIQKTTATNSGVYIEITNLTIGATYKLTASVFIVEGTARIALSDGGGFTPISTKDSTILGRQTMEVEFTLSDAANTIRVFVGVNGSGSHDVYFDDAQICRIFGHATIDHGNFTSIVYEDCVRADADGSTAQIGIIQFGKNTGSNYEYSSGMRFRYVRIPQGATITQAFVRFTPQVIDTSTSVIVDIYGEDNSSPAVFSNYADYTGRVRTTAKVDWTIPTFPNQIVVDTPSIVSIIQEIVNRNDWQSGNNLALLFDDDGSSDNTSRQVYEADLSLAGMRPVLHVEYDGGNDAVDLISEPADLEETHTERAYIMNRYQHVGLTHIFLNNDAAVYSQNLLDTTPPYNLLPTYTSGMLANYKVYFGIETTNIDGQPFFGLVFDILQAASASTSITIVWEYYDGTTGPGWRTFAAASADIADHTDGGDGPFTQTGINPVYWQDPFRGSGDWDATTINGVTAWWVRARITTLSGTDTPPIQQNRHPYAITTPYIDFKAKDIGGDITALAEIALSGHGAADGNESAEVVIAGLRAMDRGEHFLAYLNFSDENQPSYVTVTTGTFTSFVTDNEAPGGRALLSNFTGPPSGNIGSITIAKEQAKDFFGRFRLFLRAQPQLAIPTQDSINIYINVGFGSGGFFRSFHITETLTLVDDERDLVLDFGVVDIPGVSYTDTDVFGTLSFNVQAEAATSNSDFNFYDLILIPIDEMYFRADFQGQIGSVPSWGSLLGKSTGGTPFYNELIEGSVSLPKRTHRATLRILDTNEFIMEWFHNTTGLFVLSPGEDQRLWIFSVGYNANNAVVSSYTHYGNGVSLQHNNRYTGMAGRN